VKSRGIRSIEVGGRLLQALARVAIVKALLDCTNDISGRLGFSASARK